MDRRDRAVEIVKMFRARAEGSLRSAVAPELLAEYVANPVGPHSDGLAALLRYFRAGPSRGKLAVVCQGPGAYGIARLSGTRGVAPVLENGTYSTVHEAVIAVFVRRVDSLFGQ